MSIQQLKEKGKKLLFQFKKEKGNTKMVEGGKLFQMLGPVLPTQEIGNLLAKEKSNKNDKTRGPLLLEI